MLLLLLLLQTTTVNDLQLVQLKNHEEQLQQDPSAKLTKVRPQGRGTLNCWHLL
jgi:hypothetical protein